jgi:UDPglucose 6-dehydrogenase
MSIVSAEITKISLNSYVTMKISFANTLANICEAIPEANIDDITRALGADKRISPYYLKGGLSYGGPCFPRDNRAFSAFARKYNAQSYLAQATDEVNRFQIQHLSELVLKHAPQNNNAVAILGLTYKANTPVIEESPAINLIRELLKKDKEIIVYDPLAMENTRGFFGDNILYASSVKDCLAHAAVCVITTPDAQFKKIDRSYITHKPMLIIDCWRILDPDKLGPKVKYFSVGKANKG